MSAQDGVVMFGKILPIILDVAGLVPGLNIPVNAIKLVSDGVQLEEATYALLTSKSAAPVRDAVAKLAHELGVHPKGVGSKITVTAGHVPPPSHGLKWDIWQGWVAA